MWPYKHEIVNLRFVKAIDIWTDILLSNLLVLLISHISPSLNIKQKHKNILFWEDTRNIPLAPTNTKWLFLKFDFLREKETETIKRNCLLLIIKESLSSKLFKKSTDLSTKKFEIYHRPLKTRSDCFLNWKSRRILQRTEEVSNKAVQSEET